MPLLFYDGRVNSQKQPDHQESRELCAEFLRINALRKAGLSRAFAEERILKVQIKSESELVSVSQMLHEDLLIEALRINISILINYLISVCGLY